MSKHTNLDIKDEACLHIVHILQHPTSRPTTNSRQTTMVNAPKQHFSPLLAGKYGKSIMRSTQRRHQANEGQSGLEEERVRPVGALGSLWSKKKLAAEKWRETHYLSTDQNNNGSRIMLRERPLGQEIELKMQRQQFSRRRKIQGKLETWDWWTESLKRDLRRWWFLSETVWVILKVPAMGRMQMTNLAGWWAQSLQQCSSACRGFVRSTWSSTNWHNRDGRTQLITSVREIRSTAYPHCRCRQSFNSKRMMMQWHLYRQWLESCWSVLILSPEYRKCCMALLDQWVVISSLGQWDLSRTRAYPVMSTP